MHETHDKRLLVIIPFRDRKPHLDLLVPALSRYLTRNNIEFEIVVVNQTGDAPFNRGMLLNIGFLMYGHGADYIACHDVDMIPIKEVDYGWTPTVRRLRCPTKWTMGGTVLINSEVFVRVNGWSNQYWGWGGEDRNMAHRMAHHGIEIGTAMSLRNRKKGADFYEELESLHDDDRKASRKANMELTKRLKDDPSLNAQDGLSDCNAPAEVRSGLPYKWIDVELRNDE
jgi:hypothetical protein